MKYNKKNRQKAILSIITNKDVSTQEELVELLRKNNWNITQATVSRDIRELGLTKVASDGSSSKYVSSVSDSETTENKLVSVFVKAVLSFDCSANLVVIKTLPGMASASAAAIDSMHFPEAMGTIAGDDTIFIATKSALVANHLMEKMRALAEE
jgi:transcriptional regulator of arginine metabolism